DRHGLDLPRPMQVDFSNVIQAVGDETGKEVDAATIWQVFQDTYVNTPGPVTFHGCRVISGPTACRIEADVTVNGEKKLIKGSGTGPIDAYLAGLEEQAGISASVQGFHEHAVATGSGAEAAAYVEVDSVNGVGHGACIDANTVTASLKAVTNAVNRSLQ
ncbi:MAG: alpha-isopropylmalate synthase regulatory domain-containing protein, partial [Nitratireductor sp.]